MANANGTQRPQMRRSASPPSPEVQRRLMQQALDDELTPEALRELRRQLDDSPEEAAQYSRLKQVDRLLRGAPMENAPEGLALKIMARLAEGLQSQKLVKPNSLALAIALAILALTMTPLLAALGWLIINALGSAAALNSILTQLFNLLAAVMNTLEGLVDSAQAVLRTYPEAPVAIVTVIPVALLWLWRSSRGGGAGDKQTENT